MSQTYRLVATAMLAALCFVLQISNNVLGLQTGFGMTIDLVAVPAILALFIFGFESAFDVLLLATIFIALFAPTGPIGAAMKFAATVPTLIVCAGYMMARKKGSNATALLLVTALSVLASIILFLLGAFAYSYLGQSNSLLFGLLPIAAMALASYLLLKAFEKGDKNASVAHRLFSDRATIITLAVLVLLVRGSAMIVSNFYFAGPLYFKISPEQFVSMIDSTSLLFFGKGSAWYTAIFAFNALQAVLEIALAWLIAFELGFAKKYSKAW